jgi:hypothetical protein
MAAQRKYNWEGLFKRPCTVLVRGRDYQCSQSTMMQMIRTRASRARLSVSITDTGNKLHIEVRRRDEVSHTDPAAIPA